jgi:uncharacterized membrane protein
VSKYEGWSLWPPHHLFPLAQQEANGMKYTYSPDEDKEQEEPRHEPGTSVEASLGIRQNIGGLLTYVVGWATMTAFLFIEKENSCVRLRAAEPVAVFVPLSIASIVAPFVPFVGGFLTTVLGITKVCLWLFFMFQTFIGARYQIPIAGNWTGTQIKGTFLKSF